MDLNGENQKEILMDKWKKMIHDYQVIFLSKYL